MSNAAHGVRGAIDPLLGYLSSAIRDEAQLLGGARCDAQFIKDEMESMNGFLHYLAKAGKDQEHDHQVRAWMKQVRDLAYDTEDCIHLYTRRVGTAPRARGAWGHVRQIPFFLRTIPVRHRAATQMRELKARARDVGERRKRYGVMVPAKATGELDGGSGDDAANDEETDASRRGSVVDELTDTHNKDKAEELIRWLKEEGHRRRGREETYAEEPGEGSTNDAIRAKEDDASGLPIVLAEQSGWIHWLYRRLWSHASDYIRAKEDDASGRPIVLAVVAPDGEDGRELVKELYQHSSLGRLFDCKACVTIQRPPFLGQILHDMVMELLPAQQGRSKQIEERDEQQLLREFVKGKRFLVVVEDVEHPYPWNQIKGILDSSGCSPGSAIIVTTKDGELAKKCSPDKTKIHSLVQFCFEIAEQLIPREDDYDLKGDAIRCILKKCNPDLFCMKLLLRALYADPNTSKKQLEDLCTSLRSQGAKKHIRGKMMKFGYDKLPKIYKRCLLYLSISPPNFNIRRTSLVRRWVAEGHVTEGDGLGALDRAERCFDELVAQGFVTITRADSVGNVITCKVQDFVHDFITEIVRDENFGDASLPPNLARHLSISSGIQWQQDPRKKKQHGCGSIGSCFSPAERQGARDGIIPFLESLPAFSRVGRVKVMDLDDCKDLKNHHLKYICNKLFMLKYLSLRNTEVSRIPREIKKLQQLETLDIRQTKVRACDTKGLVLPMMKHLLAGPIDYRVHASINPDQPFPTVRMPRKIGRMTNMEILCHVEVLEDDAELEQVKGLKCLRDLGVVIHGTQDNVDRLLRVINELSECLSSLSVWIRRPARASHGGALHMNINDHTLSPPKSLQGLSINGITGGLPNWINGLSCLAEITLRETLLSDTSLPILGKLQGLRCLRLRHKSYSEENLTFKDSEFNKLEFLVIQGSDIIRIAFESSAAPKLAKIVWTFGKMDIRPDTISGIDNLLSLKEFELNGDGDPDHVKQAVAAHPNLPVFRYSFPDRIFQGPDARAHDVSITE